MAEMTSPRCTEERKADKVPADAVSEIDSRMLLGRDGRILIRHNGHRYELRETRFGKLILTK